MRDLYIPNTSVSLISANGVFETPSYELVNNSFITYLRTLPEWEYYLSLLEYTGHSIDAFFKLLISKEDTTLTETDISSFIEFVNSLCFVRSSYIGILTSHHQVNRFVTTISSERELSKKHKEYFKQGGEAFEKITTLLNTYSTYKYQYVQVKTGHDALEGGSSYRTESNYSVSFFEFELLKLLDRVLSEFEQIKKDYFIICKEACIQSPSNKFEGYSYRSILQKVMRKDSNTTFPVSRRDESSLYYSLDAERIPMNELTFWYKTENDSYYAKVDERMFNYIPNDVFEILVSYQDKFNFDDIDTKYIDLSNRSIYSKLREYRILENKDYKKYIPLIMLFNNVKRKYFSEVISKYLTTDELARIFEYNDIVDILLRSIDSYKNHKEKQQKTV